MSSEVQSRPAASRGGRGASRGGRGGFSGRGSSRRANGEAKTDDASPASVEDEGEIGQLKKLYGVKTTLIREMFPDWSEVDILFALRETDGDENLTVTRIAEGTISQWDEVSKPKKERTKAKLSAPAAADAARPRRDGAGPDKTRGRANARAERGGRSARGRSAQPAAANGTHTSAPLSVPTEEAPAWDGQKPDDEPASAPATAPASAPTPAPAPAPAAATPKTWASMLRQTVAPPPKPAAKPKEAAPAHKAPEPTESTPPSSAPAPTDDSSLEPPADAAAPEPTAGEAVPAPAAKEAAAPDVAVPAVAVPDIAIAPSKDALTESNLEQVDDDSHPPDTDTLRSETADSWDPRAAALAGANTPISASQQQHAASKALGSGYAATASKATDRVAVRTPSYSRRILDQEEAVRMPVNRDVDRAAVQFGALNFNGAGDEDIDGDREEPETRTQPPEESPVAHPRASLPPVAPPASVPDAFAAAQKPAAAAAAAATPAAPSTLPSAAAAAAPVAAPPVPAAQPYGRYGQSAPESAFGQKPYDAYGQPAQVQQAPAPANSQFDNYQGIPTATQAQQTQPAQPAQQAPAAYSSAPNEYAQYFTSDAQSRMPQYNSYYQTYGHQAAQGHQDGVQNQRSYGGYDSLSQYPQSSGASRFGAGAGAAPATAADAQNSGSTTPNPPLAGQPQQQIGAQNQHGHQHQPNQYQSYASHPYYGSPYYAQYMGQYGAFGAQNNFGPYGGKGGYGGSHPYSMTPQNPYDHSASQVSGGFGGASALHRGAGADASGLGSAGLSDYGRVGVGAAGQSVGQQTGFSGVAGGHEAAYGRGGGASSYQSQSGQGYAGAQQQSQVGAQQAGADDLKAYGDASKGAAGPNPSLNRPGSATNAQAAQAGLPPPQSSQQGGVGAYGGYPSHLQHGAGGLHGNNQSAAGGAGGYGGNQPYGSYGGHNVQHGGHGQGFGSNNYYSNQQQRGGWGGNYH